MPQQVGTANLSGDCVKDVEIKKPGTPAAFAFVQFSSITAVLRAWNALEDKRLPGAQQPIKVI